MKNLKEFMIANKKDLPLFLANMKGKKTNGVEANKKIKSTFYNTDDFQPVQSNKNISQIIKHSNEG